MIDVVDSNLAIVFFKVLVIDAQLGTARLGFANFVVDIGDLDFSNDDLTIDPVVLIIVVQDKKNGDLSFGIIAGGFKHVCFRLLRFRN